MASGDTLCVFLPTSHEPPSSSYPTLDLRNGHPVLDFDASATPDETTQWTGVLPRNYAGGGLTATIYWMATSATSGACRWQGAIERMDVGGTDFDSDSFATQQSGGTTAPGTSGQIATTALTFTSGANMDSLAAGEPFRFRLNRDADGTTGTDDMAGDAELVLVEIKET